MLKFLFYLSLTVGLMSAQTRGNSVINQGTHKFYAAEGDSVAVVDTAAGRSLTRIPSVAGGKVVLNEAANRVYLTAPDGASLQVVDGAANAVIRSVAPPAMAGARGSYRPLGFDAAANWLFDS